MQGPPAGSGWNAAGHQGPAGPWSAPASGYAPNPAAPLQPPSQRRGAVEFFFKAPASLPEGQRGLYTFLTIASLPLLVLSFVSFFMLKARVRRNGATVFTGGYAQFLGTMFLGAIFVMCGDALGVNPYLVAIPLLVLAWIPLGVRHLLAYRSRSA